MAIAGGDRFCFVKTRNRDGHRIVGIDGRCCDGSQRGEPLGVTDRELGTLVNVGASGAGAIVTWSALAVEAVCPPSEEVAVTPSVTVVASAEAGAIIARPDRLLTVSVQVPLPRLVPWLSDQPDGTPVMVTRPSESSLSTVRSLMVSAIEVVPSPAVTS
jgi:hypothetical protein